MKIIRTVAALVVVLLLVASCGRKAPPRLPAYERPSVPTDIEAVHRERSVILNWEYPSGKIRYVREFQVMRAGKMLGSTKEAYYEDSNVEVGAKHDYTVLAVSTGGIISEGTGRVEVEISEVPAAPEKLRAKVVDKGVELTWSHPEEGRLFNVYRSDEDPKGLVRPLNREPLSGTMFTDNPLMERPVYYSVRALTGGTGRHEGPASEVILLAPEAFVPSAPGGLKAVMAGDKILLAWKENPEIWVRAYRVYRVVAGREYVLIGESRTPSFIDVEPPLGKISYKVKAVGPAAEGPFSEPSIPR